MVDQRIETPPGVAAADMEHEVPAAVDIGPEKPLVVA